MIDEYRTSSYDDLKQNHSLTNDPQRITEENEDDESEQSIKHKRKQGSSNSSKHNDSHSLQSSPTQIGQQKNKEKIEKGFSKSKTPQQYDDKKYISSGSQETAGFNENSKHYKSRLSNQFDLIDDRERELTFKSLQDENNRKLFSLTQSHHNTIT